MTDPLARFECSSIDDAKAIILMPEAGLSPEERWVQETEWLRPRLILEPGAVLDFGCGIGRLAKLVAGPVCPVTGIDVSASMRHAAARYVSGDHFRVGAPEDLDRWIADGWQARSVICAWILQHVLDPRREIGRIAEATAPGGRLYLLNRAHRAVPVGEDQWFDDEFSIVGMLSAYFKPVTVQPVPLCAPGAYFSQWRRM